MSWDQSWAQTLTYCRDTDWYSLVHGEQCEWNMFIFFLLRRNFLFHLLLLQWLNLQKKARQGLQSQKVLREFVLLEAGISISFKASFLFWRDIFQYTTRCSVVPLHLIIFRYLRHHASSSKSRRRLQPWPSLCGSGNCQHLPLLVFILPMYYFCKLPHTQLRTGAQSFNQRWDAATVVIRCRGTWDSSVGCVGSSSHLFPFVPTKLFLKNTRIMRK